MYHGCNSCQHECQLVCSFRRCQLGAVVRACTVSSGQVKCVRRSQFEHQIVRLQVCDEFMQQCFFFFLSQLQYCRKDWVVPSWVSLVVRQPIYKSVINSVLNKAMFLHYFMNKIMCKSTNSFKNQENVLQNINYSMEVCYNLILR